MFLEQLDGMQSAMMKSLTEGLAKSSEWFHFALFKSNSWIVLGIFCLLIEHLSGRPNLTLPNYLSTSFLLYMNTGLFFVSPRWSNMIIEQEKAQPLQSRPRGLSCTIIWLPRLKSQGIAQSLRRLTPKSTSFISGIDKEQHEQWHRADLAKAVTAKEENKVTTVSELRDKVKLTFVTSNNLHYLH